jgi:hypothetical protein
MRRRIERRASGLHREVVFLEARCEVWGCRFNCRRRASLRNLEVSGRLAEGEGRLEPQDFAHGCDARRCFSNSTSRRLAIKHPIWVRSYPLWDLQLIVAQPDPRSALAIPSSVAPVSGCH